MKLKEIPLYILLAFTLIYSIWGESDCPYWSGLYFFVNYLTLLLLFHFYTNKKMRIIGISLSFSILIFIFCKYFLELNVERIYTLVTFFICLISLIYIENAHNKRTN